MVRVGFKGNLCGFLNVEFRVEGGSGRDCGLTQVATTPEGGHGNSPACGVEGLGDVKVIRESIEVVQCDGGTLLFLEGGAFLVSSCPSQLNPSVVARPRRVVDVVPGFDAGHPGFDSAA